MKVPKRSVFSLSFEPLTKSSAKRRIQELLVTPTTSLIFTPNTTMLAQSIRDPKTADLLRRADLLLPDGMGVITVSRLLGEPLPARIAGIDMAEYILALAEKRGLRVFLLGGKPGVAERAATKLQRRYPNLKICGTHHGYFGSHREERHSLLAQLREAHPQILFACLGFPKQEAWLLQNRHFLTDLRLGMGLGGSLDVWSGDKKRAPSPLGRVGLEWLWRALREPRRLSVIRDGVLLLREGYKQKKGRKRPLCSMIGRENQETINFSKS